MAAPLMASRPASPGLLATLAIGGGGLLTAAAAALPGGILGLCALLLFAVPLLYSLRKQPSLQLVITLAFAVRAAASIVHSYAVALPDSHMDAIGFELLAQEWASGGWRTIAANFKIGAFTYSWLISIPYFLFGHSPLMVQAINVLLGTLIVLNVYRLASFYFDDRTALRLTYVAALFPSLVLYSAITMREVFVTYPLTLGLIFFARWLRERKSLYFALGTGSFLIAGIFHYAVLMCYLVFVSSFLLKNFIDTVKHGSAFQIVVQLFAGVTVVPTMLYVVLTFRTDFGRLIDLLGDLPKFIQLMDRVMSSRVEGRLAYLQGAEITTFGDILAIGPLRVLYFLFSPFPWQIQAAADVFLSLDGLLYAAMVLIIILAVVRGRGRADLWPVLVAMITMSIVFSFGTSNSGTAFRHRAKIAPLFIVASGAMLAGRRQDKVAAGPAPATPAGAAP